MGYTVQLVDPETNECVAVAPLSSNDNQPPFYRNVASLDITFNYTRHYAKIFGMPLSEWLDEKKAIDTIPHLQRGVRELGTLRDMDYWQSTEGNAGYVLSILVVWAMENPGAFWSVR